MLRSPRNLSEFVTQIVYGPLYLQQQQLAEERESQREYEDRESESRPRCPHCGGRLDGQFPKCQHCACDISWIDGEPCDPAQEPVIRAASSKKKTAVAKRRERLIEITIGTPSRCPQCQRSRPGMTSLNEPLDSTEYAMEWLRSMSDNKMCPDCEPTEKPKVMRSKWIWIGIPVAASFGTIAAIVWSLL